MTPQEIDHIAESDKKASISCAHENDLIPRKAAIEAITNIAINERDTDRGLLIFCGLSAAISVIDDLPSAQPEATSVTVGRTKGETTLWYECDHCGMPVTTGDCFCANCGRKLVWKI